MFLQLGLKRLGHKSQIHGFLLLSTCSHSSLEVTSTGFDLTAGKKKENIKGQKKKKQVNISKYYPATCSVNFPVLDTIWHSSPPSLLSLHSLERRNVFSPSLSYSLRKLYFSVLINKMRAEGCSRFTGRL